MWLHHIREGQPCDLVPILCGSFDRFLSDEAVLESDPVIDPLVRVLRETVASRRAIVVAAGDLSHIGPAFGGRPVDIVGRARLKAFDEVLIGRICAGDERGFLDATGRAGNRNNVCGVSVIYLAMRALAPVLGERVAYEVCPADERGTSFVSVCGVVLR